MYFQCVQKVQVLRKVLMVPRSDSLIIMRDKRQTYQLYVCKKKISAVYLIFSWPT